MPRCLDEITGAVIDTAVRIHRSLGPGLLESAYDPTMATLLARRGLKVERQRVVGIELEGVRVEKAFVIDLLVEDRVIVEIKSVETLPRVSFRQVLTDLRLTKLHVPEGASMLRINRAVSLAPPKAGDGGGRRPSARALRAKVGSRLRALFHHRSRRHAVSCGGLRVLRATVYW